MLWKYFVTFWLHFIVSIILQIFKAQTVTSCCLEPFPNLNLFYCTLIGVIARVYIKGMHNFLSPWFILICSQWTNWLSSICLVDPWIKVKFLHWSQSWAPMYRPLGFGNNTTRKSLDTIIQVERASSSPNLFCFIASRKNCDEVQVTSSWAWHDSHSICLVSCLQSSCQPCQTHPPSTIMFIKSIFQPLCYFANYFYFWFWSSI